VPKLVEPVGRACRPPGRLVRALVSRRRQPGRPARYEGSKLTIPGGFLQRIGASVSAALVVSMITNVGNRVMKWNAVAYSGRLHGRAPRRLRLPVSFLVAQTR
jgi:hypothetical protein